MKTNSPKYWITPSNNKDYLTEQAFAQQDEIDWRFHAKVQTGDIVYIYISAPESCVRFKTKVTQIDLASSEWMDDDAFYVTHEMDERKRQRGYSTSRLRLIAQVPKQTIPIAELRKHGLKGNIQSTWSLNTELQAYIEEQFDLYAE